VFQMGAGGTGLYGVNQPAELQFYDFKTKHLKKTGFTTPARIGNNGLAVTPDKRRLVFPQVDELGSNIMLVETSANRNRWKRIASATGLSWVYSSPRGLVRAQQIAGKAAQDGFPATPRTACAAVVAGRKSAGAPQEAWIAADSFKGSFRI